MEKIKNFILKNLNETNFNKILYYYFHIKKNVKVPKLNLKNPQSFNHKIIWLKMNYKIPNATILADKYLVKEWVLKKTGKKKIIIPTIGIWKSANEINLCDLPNSFILKTNHASGFNHLVKNKLLINESKLKKKLNNWLDINYYDIGKEYQYRNIKPLIIAEPLIKCDKEGQLLDYKFFCFNGRPKYIQVDIDRFINHKRNFYDLEWNKLPFSILYPNSSKHIKKPTNLKGMLDIVKNLSKDFPFVRVDLYNCDGQIYFGELTLHPGGGCEPIVPNKWDFIIGSHLKVPIKFDAS